MKFSLGDQVLLKRSGEEATLTAFLGGGMVEVQVGEVRFPTFEEDIEHPYFNWFTQPKKQTPPKAEAKIPTPEKAAPPRLSRGIYLSFFPKFDPASGGDILQAFALHLINETAERILFDYEARAHSGPAFLALRGTLPAFAYIFLHSLSLEELNERPDFCWQLAPADKSLPSQRERLRIRAPRLARYIQGLQQEGAPSFSILLREEAAPPPAPPAPDKLPAMPPPAPPQAGAKPARDLSPAVLDLHMKSQAPPGILLQAQLQRLEQGLHDAFVRGQSRMIIIHGIGRGKLREAVHQLLRDTPFVRDFKHEWLAGYGWGATQLWFTT